MKSLILFLTFLGATNSAFAVQLEINWNKKRSFQVKDNAPAHAHAGRTLYMKAKSHAVLSALAKMKNGETYICNADAKLAKNPKTGNFIWHIQSFKECSKK